MKSTTRLISLVTLGTPFFTPNDYQSLVKEKGDPLYCIYEDDNTGIAYYKEVIGI
ncbi:hypothetical protein [Macrococcus animalis]|uniref:hypothetical protein n=1 Tax=Macrococcus animalis TaxID=3395467 RepID=UPI0039BDDD82